MMAPLWTAHNCTQEVGVQEGQGRPSLSRHLPGEEGEDERCKAAFATDVRRERFEEFVHSDYH